MKKGFTLVELLTVIIILSLLTLITATIVSTIVKSGKTSINSTQKDLIVKAAELWYSDNREYLPENGLCSYVTLDTLKYEGILDDEVFDIETMNLLSDNTKVKVSAKEGSSGKIVYKYEYNPVNVTGCTNVTDDTSYLGSYIAPRANDTHKGIVYLDPTDLTKSCNSTSVSENTSLNSGCMKFYIYDETAYEYVLILDHNTSGNVAWNSTGAITSMKEVNERLLSDTQGWSGNPRLISSNEIAKITKANGRLHWDSNRVLGTNVSNQSSWYYLDGSGNSYDGWQTQVANSSNKSKYAWLFDNTNTCSSYGCEHDNSTTNGYWTSDATQGSNSAWLIDNNGKLNYKTVNSTDYGVRPVITIPKSVIDSVSRVIAIPTTANACKANLVYTGSEQTMVGNFDKIIFTNSRATNAGTYTITATIENGLELFWEDSTTDPKTFECTISPISVEPRAVCQNKSFDGNTNADCNLSISTLFSGDTVGFNKTCTFDTEFVGTNKSVTCNNISLTGDVASNYSLITNSATATASITAQQIQPVTGLQISTNGIVTWTASSNATGYEISMDGTNYESATSGINYLSKIIASTGERTVYVRAINSDTTNYSGTDAVLQKKVNVYTLTINRNNANYGTVSASSMNVISGTTYSTSNNTLTVSANNSTLQTVTATPTATTGYSTTFGSWSSASGTISSNTTVTANFNRSENTATLSYNNNGHGTAPSSTTMYYTQAANAASAISASGWTFKGWNTAANGSGTAYAAGGQVKAANVVPSNVTLFAQWADETKPTHTGVTVSDVSSTGYKVTVTGVADTNGSGVNRVQFPTWTNHNGQDDLASNWQTNSSVTGTNKGNGTWEFRVNNTDHNNEAGYYFTHIYIFDNAGNYEAFTANTTVYNGNSGAVSVPAVTASFNANGGSTANPATIVKGYNSQLGTLPTTSLNGYSFVGWFTASSGGSQISTTTTMPSSNVTYWAHWSANTYYITYNGNGATGNVPATQAFTFNNGEKISTTVPTRTGYTFSHWKYSNGSNTFNPGASIPSGWGSFQLDAQWNEKTGVISYNNNGHGTAPSSTTMYYTQAANAASAISATGWGFTGWNTAADGSGTTYAAGARVKNANVEPSSITLYAQWTDNQAPTISNVSITNVTATGYDVTVTGVTDNGGAGVNRVQFPTWTSANGQDDIQYLWTEASSTATGTDKGNGTWTYRVNTVDHKNESGTYNTHIYTYDNKGNYNCVWTGTVTVPQATTAPQITYNFNKTISFSAGQYLDTGYVVNWDRDFVIEVKATIPTTATSKDRYLLAGNYYQYVSGTKDLSIEVNESRQLRVWINNGDIGGHLKRSDINNPVRTGEEVTYVFTWNASTKKYTFTARGAQTNVSIPETYYNISGSVPSQYKLRAGTADNRGSAPYSLYTLSKLSITTKQTYGTAMSDMPTPTFAGNTFQGWYSTSMGGTQVTSSTPAPAVNTTYYANWGVPAISMTASYPSGSTYASTGTTKVTGYLTGSTITYTCTGSGGNYPKQIIITGGSTVTNSGTSNTLTATYTISNPTTSMDPVTATCVGIAGNTVQASSIRTPVVRKFSLAFNNNYAGGIGATATDVQYLVANTTAADGGHTVSLPSITKPSGGIESAVRGWSDTPTYTSRTQTSASPIWVAGNTVNICARGASGCSRASNVVDISNGSGTLYAMTWRKVYNPTKTAGVTTSNNASADASWIYFYNGATSTNFTNQCPSARPHLVCLQQKNSSGGAYDAAYVEFCGSSSCTANISSGHLTTTSGGNACAWSCRANAGGA